jgi:hypothetical protein
VGELGGRSAHVADVGDASRTERRLCTWCERPIPERARRDARFCGRKCRQAAFRVRRRSTTSVAGRGRAGRRVVHVADAGDSYVSPRHGRFAYADPPYPGRARKYYADEPTYGGEVDHQALVAELVAGGYVGWALSTAADALAELLPLCPPDARVCAWVKPIGASTRTYGLHSCWEPLVVVGGRRLRPGVRDWLAAQPARFGGDLPGRKPLAFCAWLFDCLGMQPGDELTDLFPGTGVVGSSWRELSSAAAAPGDGCRSPTSPTTRLQAVVAQDLGETRRPGSGRLLAVG